MFFLLFKPVVYLALFVLASTAWSTSVPMTWWRPIVATIVRITLGLVAGFLVGGIVASLRTGWNSSPPSDLALELVLITPIRIALWYAITSGFFSAAPRRQRLVFSLVASAISTALELLDTEGQGWASFIPNGIC